MTNFGSWRLWVIVLLALVTMACAGRRERREEAREARAERAEQKRAERVERNEQRRAEREGSTSNEPNAAASAPPPRQDRRERAEQRRAERREAIEQRRAQREGQPSAAAEPPPEAPAAAPARAPARAPAAAATVVATSAPAAAAADTASKVIFMRVSKQSSGSNASLFDVTEPGAPKFVGNVNAGTKISYPLNPGIYTFMVVGETAEFMQATIISGKTYYALVIPRAGAKRFAIEPVRRNELGGKEFLTWDRGTKLMTDTGTAQGFNEAEISDKRNRYWQDWGKKAAGERAELTINAEDGR
ncbi:MAG: hypothetical protein QOD26_1961 [Betaproteobacteria bacterium]|jgi:hypothetical protein|nr:hypothetical protein [Betaproteobacteria bacterium]